MKLEKEVKAFNISPAPLYKLIRAFMLAQLIKALMGMALSIHLCLFLSTFSKILFITTCPTKAKSLKEFSRFYYSMIVLNQK